MIIVILLLPIEQCNRTITASSSQFHVRMPPLRASQRFFLPDHRVSGKCNFFFSPKLAFSEPPIFTHHQNPRKSIGTLKISSQGPRQPCKHALLRYISLLIRRCHDRTRGAWVVPPAPSPMSPSAPSSISSRSPRPRQVAKGSTESGKEGPEAWSRAERF